MSDISDKRIKGEIANQWLIAISPFILLSEMSDIFFVRFYIGILKQNVEKKSPIHRVKSGVYFFGQFQLTIFFLLLHHFIDFSPKKSNFSSKCACISSNILSFLPNNPLCFYNENSPKVNFSSNCSYNTGHFIDFSPKVIFSSKCASISSTILSFLPNNPVCFYTKNSQKVNFSSNCA